MSLFSPPPDAIPMAADNPSATLFRRMMAFTYEGMVLFGLGLIPGAIGALFVKVLGAHEAWQSENRLRVITFVIFGIYFVWCWSRSGQTLPMRTWHVRVQTLGGQRLTQTLAFKRYVLCWLWIAPGWLLSQVMGWRGWPALACAAVNVVVYAALSLLSRDQQFWHDQWLGTRVVDTRGSSKD